MNAPDVDEWLDLPAGLKRSVTSWILNEFFLTLITQNFSNC